MLRCGFCGVANSPNSGGRQPWACAVAAGGSRLSVGAVQHSAAGAEPAEPHAEQQGGHGWAWAWARRIGLGVGPGSVGE